MEEFVNYTQLGLIGASILILIYAFLKMNEKVDHLVKTNEELKDKVDSVLDKLNKHFPDEPASS